MVNCWTSNNSTNRYGRSWNMGIYDWCLLLRYYSGLSFLDLLAIHKLGHTLIFFNVDMLRSNFCIQSIFTLNVIHINVIQHYMVEYSWLHLRFFHWLSRWRHPSFMTSIDHRLDIIFPQSCKYCFRSVSILHSIASRTSIGWGYERAP